MLELLTAAEMKKADELAIAGDIPGFQLIENAALAVATLIQKDYSPVPVLVLCGPGNNGADGILAAAHLKKAGWTVRVACLVRKNLLKNDAGKAAAQWDGELERLNSNLSLKDTDLVIDAVFGTGFKGNLDPELVTLFDKIRNRKLPVLAIDIPSGIDASSGRCSPGTLKAERTITFCRKKIAHVLLPAKQLCGKIHTAEVGIPDRVITSLETNLFENHPFLWLRNFPVPGPDTHKYDRGHAVIFGGREKTGAACLAAGAAQRAGAGLVSILSTPENRTIYSLYRASIMNEVWQTPEDLKSSLRDPRKNCIVIGPGGGKNEELKEAVHTVLSFNKTTVLDADVFSAFADAPESLFSKLSERCVLTPHEGEFERLFPGIAGNKLERARAAAKLSGAILLFKGSDSVIAAPDGTAIINTGASPTLATAGSGDVLAGIIAGLAAQGMPLFTAVAAAVWLHGASVKNLGFGVTAEDIINHIPQTLNHLFQIENNNP